MEKTAEQKSTILSIQICIFCLLCSLTIPASSIPALNKDMGSSASSLGTARTVGQLWGLVLGLGVPSIIHTIGSKSALTAICALAGTGILVCAMASSVTMLYAGIILGVSRMHVVTVGKTMIADICESDELPKQFGTIGMISGLAFVVGPVISIILTKTIGGVWIAGCLSALLSISIAFSIKGTSSNLANEDATPDPSPRMMSVLPYVLVSIACTAPLASFLTGLDIYLVSRFSLDPGGIAATSAVVAIFYAISQGALSAKVHQRLGSVQCLICCGAAVAVPLLVIDYLESLRFFTMFLVLSCLAMGCVQPTVDVIMVKLMTPNKSRGTALTSTIHSINTVIMPAASGVILDAGLPLFRIVACLCAAGAALGFLVLPKEIQHDKHE